LPASLLLLAVAGRVELRAWPYAAIGTVMVIAFAGLVLDVGAATIWWSALLGFTVAAVLIIALTLPPLLCPPDDVARTAAGMFTISYTGSVAIALACGAAWDLTGVPALAFAPLVACAVAMVGVSLWMRANGELR
jgi:CP family cyanate transporter-like MFS transporter